MRIPFLFLITFWSGSSFAFMNVEAMRVHPIEGYTGNVTTSSEFVTGNTRKKLFLFGTSNRYHIGRHEILAVGNYKYEEVSAKKVANLGSTHLRYAYELRDGLYGELFGQIQFDEFRRLKQRDLLGTSVRFRLLKEEGFFIFFGSGFFAEKEQIKELEDQSDFRGNFYLSSVYQGESAVRMTLIAYYQPVWNAFADHRFNVDFDVENPIYGNLSLIYNFDYRYDSRPIASVKKTDTVNILGFRWNF